MASERAHTLDNAREACETIAGDVLAAQIAYDDGRIYAGESRAYDDVHDLLENAARSIAKALVLMRLTGVGADIDVTGQPAQDREDIDAAIRFAQRPR